MNKILVVGLTSLVFGVVIGYLIPKDIKKEPQIRVPEDAHNEQVMEGMTSALKDKDGKEFDNEFLHEMILHHAGAIEMAQMAKEKSTSDDIKTMADEIIETQSKEIKIMEEWHDKVHDEVEGIH